MAESKFGGVPVSQGSRFGGVPVGDTLMTPQAQKKEINVGRGMIGAGEALLTLATGAIAQPIGGLEGIFDMVSGAVSGKDNLVRGAVGKIENRINAMTYQPKTPEGRSTLNTVSYPFQKLDEAVTGTGNKIMAVTGSPVLATAAMTGMEMLPMGRSASPRAALGRSENIRRVTDDYRRLGIDLDESLETQRGQLTDMAARSTQGQTIRAQEMDKVQKAVQNAAEIARKNVDNMYNIARQTDAAIPVSAISGLPDITRQALSEYDIEFMPIVQRRLSELDRINAMPGNYSVKLNELERFRQRVNRNRPASTDVSQQAALGIVKGQLDSALDAAFNSSMVKGDPAGIQAWRDARGAFIDYKRNFEDQKVINQLATQQATPEEVRNWIFGASALGAKKEAGRVLSSIKDVIGAESPAFGALRQEALFDIVEPLLRETPDYGAYVTNFDRFVRNNSSVAKELFPDSIDDLTKLRRYASATNKISPPELSLDLNTTASRAIFGHQIAKSAMKVSLASQAMGLLRAATGKTERQRILSEILGYDVTTPLLPVEAPIGLGAMQTAMDQEQEDGQ